MERPLEASDFSLKEIFPDIGARNGDTGGQPKSSYDLVEEMLYLYVHVVKAEALPGKDVCPYVEAKIGNCKGVTKHFQKKSNPEWNQIFAFSRNNFQDSVLEVSVKDAALDDLFARALIGPNEVSKHSPQATPKWSKLWSKDAKDSALDDQLIGRALFDLSEVPKRMPQGGQIEPKWYPLKDRKGNKLKGGLMMTIWIGTQADEAFPNAWHSDATTVGSDDLGTLRSKVYFSPKLWYVRVNVIEAQDLIVGCKSRVPEVFVKVSIGSQVLRTRISQSQSINPAWNEDLMFVASEPFEHPVLLSVEERVKPNKDEVLGKCVINLNLAQRRLDHKPIITRWFNLKKHVMVEGEEKSKFASRIHLSVCLEGGYHVSEEPANYMSDLRPSAPQLGKPGIGILELGILGATGLVPVKGKDGRGITDAYCVAKYGFKWVRTRTITDSFSPKWNEQHAWEVFDPCTMVTIGVFDNGYAHTDCGMGRDRRIGKVRIVLSKLETGRVYTHSYPLLVMCHSGLKKMGELRLAVRFTCRSVINTMLMYSRPLLPDMHYTHPLCRDQLDDLRHEALKIVSLSLSQAKPPLRKEVVEYMLDEDWCPLSLRRARGLFFRIMDDLSGLVAAGKWFNEICLWKNPLYSILVHFLLVILICYAELILPVATLCLSLIGIWNLQWRPRDPPHVNVHLSYADAAHPDEIDEEFDTFPTTRSADIVRMRYDRLRCIGGRAQTLIGDIVNGGERLLHLLSWRDTRATTLFVASCLIATIILCVTPYRILAILVVVYILRHPMFRGKKPSILHNFFKRLPERSDIMM